MWSFGYPEGSAAELLDGTLKLRYCTDIFTMRFPPCSLPRVANCGGKKKVVTPGHLLDEGTIFYKIITVTAHLFLD